MIFHRRWLRFLCISLLIRFAYGQTSFITSLEITSFASTTCNITGINSETQANLEDLRTATPYTLTLSAIANDCSDDPQTVSFQPIAIVDGTFFSVTAPVVVTINTQTLVLISFTFPELTVTSLHPGEALTIVDDNGLDATYLSSASGADRRYYVPITALTYTPATTASTANVTVMALATTVEELPSAAKSIDCYDHRIK